MPAIGTAWPWSPCGRVGANPPGLALVGDPDRLELAHAHTCIGERLAGDRPRHLPDLARVVLHPSRSGEVLGELAVCASDRLGALVEDEAGRSGGALVDRQDHG